MDLFAQSTSLPDSIITIEHTYYYCVSDPEKAQEIMDELRTRGTDSAWELDWCQGDLYYNTGKYRLASYYFERVAEYGEVKDNPQRMMDLLSTAMEAYRLNNDNEQAIEAACRVVELATELGNGAEIGRAYMLMGEVTFNRKNKDLARSYFDLAEEHLVRAQSPHYLYHFYVTIANLMAEGQRTEAYEYIGKAEASLAQLEAESATDPLPEGMIDYERGRLYALAAELLAKAGRHAEAADYYARFMVSPSATDRRGRIYIVPYMLETGKYEQAAGIAEERVSILDERTDAVGEDMAAALRYLVQSYEMSGQPERALEYSKRATAVADSMRKNDMEQVTLELATIHDVQRKEALIAEQKSALRQRNISLVASGMVTLLILGALTYIMTLYRKKRTAYEQLVQRSLQWAGKESDLSDKAGQREEYCGDKKQASKMDSEVLERLEQVMREDKPYLQPDLTLEKLAAIMNIPRNTLSHAINCAAGKNFNQYVNEYRVKEAINHIDANRNNGLYIEELYDLVGFNSRSSFFRVFKQMTSLSPLDFKRNLK